MNTEFNFLDKGLLIAAFGLSSALAWQDFRTRSFRLDLALGLAALGIGWCFSQAFWPMALIPLGLGVSVLWLVNRYIYEVIGDGDLLLFLISGLFIPIVELDRFLIFSGINGLIVAFICRLMPSSSSSSASKRIPFSGALLLALFMTLFLASRS